MPSPKNHESHEELSDILLQGKSRSGWYWLFWLLLLAGLGVGGYLWFRNDVKKREAVLPYITEPIQRGDITIVTTATGNLEPTNEVTIGSELSGTTEEVYVEANDRVKKGQPLAKISVRRLTQDLESSKASVTAARARVAQVQATLNEAEANLGRLKELHQLSGGRTPSKADLVAGEATVERAKADLGSAEASVGQQLAELQANESDLDKAVIKSPIDGIVLTRTVEPGQTVAASFTAPELFVLAENLEQMKLKVAVAEAEIGRVEAGQAATFKVDAWFDRVYHAKVTKVSFGSTITDNVVTYETELEVSNKDLSLRPGMTATVDISVGEAKNVLLVPITALLFDPEAQAARSSNAGKGKAKDSFVQTLMPRFPRRQSRGGGPAGPKQGRQESRVWILRDGKPAAINVKVGLSDSYHAEVTGEGLEEGVEIITSAAVPQS